MKRFVLLLTLIFGWQLARAQDTVVVTGLDNLKLLSVLWQQHSAEYRALCYQAFNTAKDQLQGTKLSKKRKYAIITDVDETVLDNSYYEARRILDGKDFDMASWKQWTAEANATAVPGALEFLQWANSKGVEVFYLSNRDTSEVDATIANLRRLGFPNTGKENMIFRSSTSSKEERRQALMKNFEVLMMLGDNLNDFAEVFEKKDNAFRNNATDSLKDQWGTKYIVLPNATYGEWENALYKYGRNLSRLQKEVLLKNALLSFPGK